MERLLDPEYRVKPMQFRNPVHSFIVTGAPRPTDGLPAGELPAGGGR